MGRRGKNLAILTVLATLMASAALGLWWILHRAQSELGIDDYGGLEAVDQEREQRPAGGLPGLRRRTPPGGAGVDPEGDPATEGGTADARLHGRWLLPDGEPAAFAWLFAVGASTDGEHTAWPAGRTDEHGRFDVPLADDSLPELDWSLLALAADCAPTWRALGERPAGDVGEQQLDRGRVIRASLRYPDDSPAFGLEFARVPAGDDGRTKGLRAALELLPGGGPSGRVAADRDGVVTVRGVDGPLRLTALDVEPILAVELDGATAEVEVVVDRFALVVHGRGPGDRPVTGARYRLGAEERIGQGASASAMFLVSGGAPRELRAEFGRLVAEPVSVDWSAQRCVELTVDLAEPAAYGTLAVTIRAEGAVAAPTLELVDARGERWGNRLPEPRRLRFEAPDGVVDAPPLGARVRAVPGVPPGDYRLTVVADGFATSAVDVTVEPAREVAVEVQLERP